MGGEGADHHQRRAAEDVCGPSAVVVALMTGHGVTSGAIQAGGQGRGTWQTVEADARKPAPTHRSPPSSAGHNDSEKRRVHWHLGESTPLEGGRGAPALHSHDQLARQDRSVVFFETDHIADSLATGWGQDSDVLQGRSLVHWLDTAAPVADPSSSALPVADPSPSATAYGRRLVAAAGDSGGLHLAAESRGSHIRMGHWFNADDLVVACSSRGQAVLGVGVAADSSSPPASFAAYLEPSERVSKLDCSAVDSFRPGSSTVESSKVVVVKPGRSAHVSLVGVCDHQVLVMSPETGGELESMAAVTWRPYPPQPAPVPHAHWSSSPTQYDSGDSLEADCDVAGGAGCELPHRGGVRSTPGVRVHGDGGEARPLRPVPPRSLASVQARSGGRPGSAASTCRAQPRPIASTCGAQGAQLVATSGQLYTDSTWKAAADAWEGGHATVQVHMGDVPACRHAALGLDPTTQGCGPDHSVPACRYAVSLDRTTHVDSGGREAGSSGGRDPTLMVDALELTPQSGAREAGSSSLVDQPPMSAPDVGPGLAERRRRRAELSQG